MPPPQKLGPAILRNILGGEVFFDQSCTKPRAIGFSLRCGGRGSPIGDRRNWEHYYVKKQGALIPGVVKINEKHGLLLNGFPENFKFPEELSSAVRMKQLGNSVAVTAVHAWGEAIINALD